MQELFLLYMGNEPRVCCATICLKNKAKNVGEYSEFNKNKTTAIRVASENQRFLSSCMLLECTLS